MATLTEHIISNLNLQSPIWLIVLPFPFLIFSIYLFYYADPIPPRPQFSSISNSQLPSHKYKDARVISVSASPTHNFTKSPSPSITLLPSLGVKGDAHQGKTVQHRSRLHIQPPPPNLRQVHLIASEILEEYGLAAGEIGENVTTRGIDLLSLSKGSKLRFMDADAADESTSTMKGKSDSKGIEDVPTITLQGLRNPCPQIESHRKGLQEKFIVRDEDQKIVARKAGVMCTVDVGGDIRPGMRIVVEESERFEALDCV